MRSLSVLLLVLAAGTALAQSGNAANEFQIDADSAKLMERAKVAEAQRKWALAIEIRTDLHKRLYMTPGKNEAYRWGDAVELGWLHLMHLDTVEARRQFEAALAAIPPPTGRRSNFARLNAISGLQRLAEMEGDYAKASELEKLGLGETRIRCGVAAGSMRVSAELSEKLRQIAAGPTAKDSLDKIRKGLDLPANVQSWQLAPYRQEAALFLAEIYYREGNTGEATKVFREIFFDPEQSDFNEMLARSYLDRIYGRTKGAQ